MAGMDSYFNPTRQSPIDHLVVLRGAGHHETRNSNSYLSPALHNSSDAWVRFLRSQSCQFCDEYGVAKNHTLLMRKNVQERKMVHKWCESIKTNANIFTLILRDVAALNMKKYCEKQTAECSVSKVSVEGGQQDGSPAAALEHGADDFEGLDELFAFTIENYSGDFDLEDRNTGCNVVTH